MKKLFILILLGFLLVGSTTSVFAAKTEEDVIDEDIDYNIDDNTEEDNTEENDDKEYFSIMSKMEETRLDEDKLYYQFYFDNELKYDYLKVTFITSSNVFLNDYQTIKLDYKETCNPIDLKFELNSDKIDIDEIPLYSEIKYDELCITAYAYLNDEVVDTQTQGLYLINSIHGIFVSEFSSFYTYDNYIGYLYSNSLIKEERYKLIAKKITELTPVDEEEKYTKKEELKKFRFFDEDIFEIQEVEVESISDVVDKINHYNKCYSSTTGDGGGSGDTDDRITTIVSPIVYISENIVASNRGKVLRISGYVQWSDIKGNIHPAKNIQVQIMDENIIKDKILSTLYTDNTGYYSATINNNTGVFENGYDIYVKVITNCSNYEVKSSDKNSMFKNGYYFSTEIENDVKSSINLGNKSFSVADDINAVCAVSIHQALNVGYYYFDQMNNHDIDSVKVVYPTIESDVEDKHTSYYTHWGNKISIHAYDYCDWDTILHELGHKVANYIGVDADFSENHYSGENLSERYGKQLGIQGAWNEGWATYFSLASQLYYDSVYVNSISCIPNVADYSLVDYYFSSDLNINYIKSLNTDYLSYRGISEGDEQSVTAILLQLLIDNKIGLTHQQIWNYIKGSQCDNFSEFYQYLCNNLYDYEQISEIGCHLELQNIVDAPYLDKSKTTSVFSRSTPGQFYWESARTKDGIDEMSDESDNFNAHEYLNECRIEFYDSDFNFIPIYLDYYNSTRYKSCTIDATNWRILTSYIDNGESFYWCISTCQTDAPSTGPYLSSFHKAYFLEDITTITNLDTLYSGYVTPNEEVIYKYVVSQSGNYTFSSSGNTDVNVTVYDSQIFENKTIADDDSGYGVNFSYSSYYYAGDIIYLKVSSSNNVSGSFNVFVTKFRWMYNNSSISNTINGTNETWYKFKAPSDGCYTFYSTGSVDTYGELFEYPTYKRNTRGRIKYNDDAGEGSNFLITYELAKDEVVYIRIRGYANYVNGSCNLCVISTKNVEKNTLYEGYIYTNGYTYYKFTVPSSGNYKFYTISSIDTYMDIFNAPVLDRTNNNGAISSNNNESDFNLNAMIRLYNLSANQTIFIRIRGNTNKTSGKYYFKVVKL